MLTDVPHVISKDASFSVGLGATDNYAVLVTLGLIGLYTILILSGRTCLVPHRCGDGAVEILTLSVWFAVARLIDWVGFQIEIPFVTNLRLSESDGNLGVEHCFLHYTSDL